MAPISSIMGQIQLVGFRSRDGSTDAVSLRRLVDRDLKPRIFALEGVAQIVTIGGQPTELHQRTPLFVGSEVDVEFAQRFHQDVGQTT